MKPFHDHETAEQAERDLQALIVERITTAGLEVSRDDAKQVAWAVVETLTWSRPDILDALTERPRRVWLMAAHRRNKSLLFRGGDEFGNPTIAIRVSLARFLVLSYRWRLNTLREPADGPPLMVWLSDYQRALGDP